MFQCKEFTIHQDLCAMKVTEIACIQGAWTPIPDEVNTILDIGSGTGLLSLMLAQRFPSKEIVALELDEASYQQGKKNISSSKFSRQIHTLLGDVRQFQSAQTFDFIICNPPFFENQLKSPDVIKNLAWHSEELSMQSLVHHIHRLLQPSGRASLLYPYQRLNELKACCKEQGFLVERILFIKHSVKHEIGFFIALLTKAISIQEAMQEEYLVVKENQVYTEKAQLLLRNFYLKL